MPAQCPSCGRFLSNDLVAGLGTAEGSCPRCGASLIAEMFGGVSPAGAAEPAAGATAPAREDPVRDDPLEGWDTAAPEVVDLAGDRVPDAVALAGAGATGLVVGTVLGRSSSRGAWAVLGGLVGLGIVAVQRRIWELES